MQETSIKKLIVRFCLGARMLLAAPRVLVLLAMNYISLKPHLHATMHGLPETIHKNTQRQFCLKYDTLMNNFRDRNYTHEAYTVQYFWYAGCAVHQRVAKIEAAWLPMVEP